MNPVGSGERLGEGLRYYIQGGILGVALMARCYVHTSVAAAAVGVMGVRQFLLVLLLVLL